MRKTITDNSSHGLAIARPNQLTWYPIASVCIDFTMVINKFIILREYKFFIDLMGILNRHWLGSDIAIESKFENFTMLLCIDIAPDLVESQNQDIFYNVTF